ncbi:MAG: polysaccharide pyruvyl transferase family protein [Pseudomonadota bacterium]
MKVVVSSALSTSDAGNEALLRKLLELLWQRRFSVEAITDDPVGQARRFSGLTLHQTPGSARGAPAVLRGPLARWRLFVARRAARLPLLARLLPSPQARAVAALRCADLIIACPGSYLANAGGAIDVHLAQLAIAARAKAPLVLAPMSIRAPDEPSRLRALTRALRGARQVFVRDAESELFCRDLGIAASLSNDISFLDDGFSAAAAGGTVQPAYVAVTVVSPPAGATAGTPARDAAQRHYLDAMVAAIGAIAGHARLPVKLIVQSDGDRQIARQLANGLAVPTDIVDVTNAPARLQATLVSSYCLIASRFDSAIAALAAGCPVAVMTRTASQRSVLDLYGLDDLGVPIETIDPEALAGLMIRWGDDRTGFRQRCASLRDSLRRVGDPFIDCLASVTVPPEG